MFARKWQVFYDTVFQDGGLSRILTGLQNTALIAIIGLIIGVLIGTLIAVIRVLPKYKVLPRVLDKICTVYVSFFRGTPIVVQLLLGYYVLFPLMGLSVSSLGVCIAIFGLNSGAYVSEIMRSGIQSVDVGQMEAGRALGLSYSSTMVSIVVPQAIKNILPTLGNEFISLIKETSIVSFVGAVDLCTAFRYIGSNNYEYMIPYLVMAAIYIILVLLITGLVKLMERSLHKSDRHN